MGDQINTGGVRRRPDDAPSDWMRGELGRRRQPASGELVQRSRKLPGIPELWVLPGAAAFAADPALGSTAGVLLEIVALGLLEDIVAELAVRRRRRHEQHRPRDPGEPVALYFVYVDRRFRSVQHFHHQLDRATLELSDYGERTPSVSELEERFKELEQDWDVLREAKNFLLRAAVTAEPRILDIVFLDPTGFSSPAVLHHACRGGCSDPAGMIRNAMPAAVEHERWEEVKQPGYGEAEPASTRTRMGIIEEVRSAAGHRRRYALHKVRGHDFRTRDLSSGLRRYESQVSWFGGWIYPFGSAFLNGETIEAQVLPADVQEYDGYPALVDSVRLATGTLPRIVSADRASSIRAMYEFNARRLITVLSPERRIAGKEVHRDWRSDRFDEDGVPRCRRCGGPGNQSWPGLGLKLSRGEPVIKFVCHARPIQDCPGFQQIPCHEEWLKLTGVSQLLELPHAVAERHSTHEHIHRHNRQRFLVGGKDISSRLYRAGIKAQRLRVAAAQLLLWLRLCLRNGWLSPRVLDVRRNEASPVRLSAPQDRHSLDLTGEGIGVARLARLRATREAEGMDRPYGMYAARLLGPDAPHG
ncbi:MAG: hypothetical protein AB7U07_00570 [Thermoleophilia bacterium]